MLGFFGGIWGKIAGLAVVALGILLAFLRVQGQARQAGRDEVLRKDAEAEAAARARMQDAAGKAPTDDAGVIERAREGRL